MAKDTFYFTHDYNSRNDEKIKSLLFKHGLRGYGIFWAVIEDLYNNANALQTDYERIAFELREDKIIVESVIKDFGLFVFEGDLFGSKSVQTRLEERDSKSTKARESAFKRWNKCERNANALQTQSEGNAIKESKEKEIKENKEITEVLKPLTLYQLCVDYWLKEFHPDWTFEAVHGKNLKSIIKKIQTMQGNNGKVVSDENGFTAFKFMCDNLPEFFKDKDLQVINSKFNEIIEQIKNKSNGHHQTQSPYRS